MKLKDYGAHNAWIKCSSSDRVLSSDYGRGHVHAEGVLCIIGNFLIISTQIYHFLKADGLAMDASSLQTAPQPTQGTLPQGLLPLCPSSPSLLHPTNRLALAAAAATLPNQPIVDKKLLHVLSTRTAGARIDGASFDSELLPGVSNIISAQV